MLQMKDGTMNIEYASPETVLQLLESADRASSPQRTAAIFLAIGCLSLIVAAIVFAGVYLGA